MRWTGARLSARNPLPACPRHPHCKKTIYRRPRPAVYRHTWSHTTPSGRPCFNRAPFCHRHRPRRGLIMGRFHPRLLHRSRIRRGLGNHPDGPLSPRPPRHGAPPTRCWSHHRDGHGPRPAPRAPPRGVYTPPRKRINPPPPPRQWCFPHPIWG